MKQDNEVMKKSSIRVRKKREEKNARSMQNLKRRLEMARLNRLMFQPEQIPFLHHVLINQLWIETSLLSMTVTIHSTIKYLARLFRDPEQAEEESIS